MHKKTVPAEGACFFRCWGGRLLWQMHRHVGVMEIIQSDHHALLRFPQPAILVTEIRISRSPEATGGYAVEDHCSEGSVTNPIFTNPALAAIEITRATCS